MVSSIRTETETVIKKILPYMRRRGYEIENDLDFETGVKTLDRYTKGYVDILEAISKIVVLNFHHGTTRRINRPTVVFDRTVI